MQKYFTFIILLFCVSTSQAQTNYCQQAKKNTADLSLQKSAAGDTVHISHYKIYVDTLNYSAQTIKARCEVMAVSKVNNVNEISLSLLQLNIDSVFYSSGNLTYNYNDTTLRITLPLTLNTNDSINISVYYHGQPKKDATGWGGFYMGSNYAFNLGVGFAALPHNFGRAWYPCIDEFTDKSTYEFFITTSPTLKAYCNGYLNSSTTNPNGTKTWHWKIDNAIPSYLACMAVADYTSWNRNYSGIPVEIAAKPADTAAVSTAFANLPLAINLFVNAYGAYPWNKIGYSLVNFGSGAMEHASNISIGRTFAISTVYETLWAHELSHMWWGDKVTCKTAADMWLNEGWATFNEAYFTEAKSGITAYKNWIRTNHRKVLQLAHVQDGNYFALNAVPDAYTYGTTVYNKGGDIVHTLRNFLGDSLFEVGCQGYQNTYAYGNANSADMRDAFTTSTGINTTNFFDDWIFTPGFPHFSIDSVVYFPGGLDHYFVYTRQRAKGNTGHIYTMPVEITISDGVQDTTVQVVIDSATNVFHIPTIIGNAQWIAIDRNEKVSDAISDFEKAITTTGNVVMTETNSTLNVQTIGNPGTIVRMEHNWVAPDGFKQSNPGIRLSDYHYWKVDGIFMTGFYSKANFFYDGSTSTTTAGWIDNTLITGTEDSLVLLYRTGTSDDWHIVTASTHNMGFATDKIGSFTIDTLIKGEYTLGYYDYTVAINSPITKATYALSVSPNPAKDICRINFSLVNKPYAIISVCDVAGKSVYTCNVFSHQQFIDWDCSKMAKGAYLINLIADGNILESTKVVIK